ncbi:hypothetical protein [Brevibacillus borstelensis]|uniref:hypothetical protein n=1 Tax=Brevibacillus borstelensis TaxID=45462 RepID=UPI0030C191E8
MTPKQPDTQQENIQRISQRLDKFEERIDKLEVQMTVATKWLERIEQRLGKMEESRSELLQAITKLQTELELKRGSKEKEIIMQMLDNDKSDMEKLTQLIEGDKKRKQERFLRVWAVLGPAIASILSSFLTKFFL